eukprot:3286363-Rhodomonas_salina.2
MHKHARTRNGLSGQERTRRARRRRELSGGGCGSRRGGDGSRRQPCTTGPRCRGTARGASARTAPPAHPKTPRQSRGWLAQTSTHTSEAQAGSGTLIPAGTDSRTSDTFPSNSSQPLDSAGPVTAGSKRVWTASSTRHECAAGSMSSAGRPHSALDPMPAA